MAEMDFVADRRKPAEPRADDAPGKSAKFPGSVCQKLTPRGFPADFRFCLQESLPGKPGIVDSLEPFVWRELLCHAPAQDVTVLEGGGAALQHLGLERGDLVVTEVAVEGVEQHNMLTVEAVVLDEGPDIPALPRPQQRRPTRTSAKGPCSYMRAK